MFRRVGALLTVLALLALPFFVVDTVVAQDIENSLCAGANFDVNSDCQSGISEDAAVERINELVATIINVFSWVVGVVSVVMIIIGGFKYITSAGDSNNITGAKNTILYAIIGLIIVALSQTVVRFILQTVIE